MSSMSQEEIEALMTDTDSEVVSEVQEESSSKEDVEADQSVDDMLANIDALVDEATDDVTEDDMSDTNIDDLLANIDGITSEDDISDSSMTDILSSIEGIEEEVKDVPEIEKYPAPVENENKVVNQLNEVAADSEEKASQIFDVLSYILDRNEELEKTNTRLIEFMNSQIELLESLAVKFPNVTIFNENLEKAKELLPDVESTSGKLTDENNKIFEAMELMQYHDINRQKIERVMAVIKKLSGYLNGIFEDSSDGPEIQVAKHLPGDESETVDAEDIDALINQYSE